MTSHRFLAIAVSALLVGAPALARAQPTAEELSAEARALVQEGKLEAALERLRVAYSLKQTHDIAGNLGLVEAELGLFIPAAEHLRAALRTFPSSGKPESRAVLERRLIDVRARLSSIALRVDRTGAEVLVDGARVGTTPLDEPVIVDPRQHRVNVRLDGFREEQVWVVPAAGTETIVDLALVADDPRTAAPAATMAPPEAPATRGFDAARPWMVGSSGVVLLSGLVVGVTSTLLSNGHASEVELLKLQLPEGRGCVGGDVPDVCLPIGDQIGRQDATAALATGGFVTAGIGLALGLTFLLVPGADGDVGAVVSPTSRGARLRF